MTTTQPVLGLRVRPPGIGKRMSIPEALLGWFKTELARVQQGGSTLLGPLSEADQAHLKRWKDDLRAKDTWNKIQTAAGKHCGALPQPIIEVSLLDRRTAEITAEIVVSQNTKAKLRARYCKLARYADQLAQFFKKIPGLEANADLHRLCRSQQVVAQV